MEITPELLQEVIGALETAMSSTICGKQTFQELLPVYKKLVGVQARSVRQSKVVYTFNGIVITYKTLQEVKQLLRQQKKIAAVRYVLEATGQDLISSKHAVDQIQMQFDLNY